MSKVSEIRGALIKTSALREGSRIWAVVSKCRLKWFEIQTAFKQFCAPPVLPSSPCRLNPIPLQRAQKSPCLAVGLCRLYRRRFGLVWCGRAFVRLRPDIQFGGLACLGRHIQQRVYMWTCWFCRLPSRLRNGFDALVLTMVSSFNAAPPGF